MRRFILIGLLIISAVVVGQTTEAAAQNRDICSLSLRQAPNIYGLSLGMTAEQVLMMFPGSIEDSEVRANLLKPVTALGVSSFIIRPDKFQSRDKFAGLSQITFTLLDGQVTSISAGYKGPAWKHVDEFVAKFSEGKTLPAANAWEASAGMDAQLKSLKCNGFELTVFAGGDGGNLNYVLLKDTEAERKLKERRAKAREKEKQ